MNYYLQEMQITMTIIFNDVAVSSSVVDIGCEDNAISLKIMVFVNLHVMKVIIRQNP